MKIARDEGGGTLFKNVLARQLMGWTRGRLSSKRSGRPSDSACS